MSAPASQVLADLRGMGVEVVAVGDTLRFRPARAVPPPLLHRIRTEKHALIELLRAESASEFEQKPCTSRELALVERRLVALLEGRLWQDKSGWWPRDTRWPRSKAERTAVYVLAKEPHVDLPPPVMTHARGAAAVRAWQQVVGCLLIELHWPLERAVRAAALVVDIAFDPTEERT